MQISEEARQITDLIYSSKHAVVLCAEEALLDGISAGLATQHLLESLGKKVTTFYSGKLPSDVNDLPGLHKVKKSSDPKDLIMTIDYEHSDIEKVRYSLDGGKLNLVFHPVPKDFDPKSVEYDISGPDYDIAFILGATELSKLGNIYHNIKEDIESITTINIDISVKNTNFGSINVVDHTASSLSELLFHKFSHWRFKPPKEAARCLLFGLSVTSDEKKSHLPLENLDSTT